jgi:hypothetical protein
MGYLTIFSETGTPHSGCLLEYIDSFEWLSFMPGIGSIFDVFPGGSYGRIDTADRETAIKTYVRFRLSDALLTKGRNKTVADYYSETYGLFINDCATFSKDMSRNCGLQVPFTAFDPVLLVTDLFSLNKKKAVNINETPHPWKIHKQSQPLGISR